MAENNAMPREIGWDEEFVAEEKSFEPLPAGDYNFTITSFERKRFNGSAKLPPCGQIVMDINLTDGVNTGSVKHSLFLVNIMEWKITEVMLATGIFHEGDHITANMIEKAVGCTGRCKVSITTSEKNGKQYKNNQIDRFYKKEEPTYSATTTQPPAQFGAPQQQSFAGGFGGGFGRG
jgi:hypothetical protein